MPWNDAVMRVDLRRLAELNVVRLRLGNLQGCLELVGLDNLCHRGSNRHVLTHLKRSRERGEHTRDAGPDLERLRLFLIKIEQRLGLVDLGLS